MGGSTLGVLRLRIFVSIHKGSSSSVPDDTITSACKRTLSIVREHILLYEGTFYNSVPDDTITSACTRTLSIVREHILFVPDDTITSACTRACQKRPSIPVKETYILGKETYECLACVCV